MIEYINFGKIVDIKTHLTTPNGDTESHVNVDFLVDESVDVDTLQNDISNLLKHPNSYILCAIEDVIDARREFAYLKKRVEELEGQLDDTKKESEKKLCEVYTETAETFYKSTDKLISIDKMITELKKERDYWKNRFGSVVEDFSKTLAANGVEFSMIIQEVSGDGKWEAVIDIPELNEVKKKVEDLEMKLNAAKSNEKHWRGRKEEEEDQHYYWFHTFDRAVKKAAEKGIHIGICGNDEDCNAGIVTVANMKVEELQKRGDYWKGESDAMTRNYHNLEKSQEKRWSAMLQALKEKGVEVLYMGEEDGKPNIDVKIPEIGDLKKELDDLKSKTVAEARYEFKPECLTLIFTMCDGSEQVFGMDSSEAIDATAISCGTVPKCKSCMNHRYFTNGGHYCHLPDSKFTIPGIFHIHSLTDEDAEGPACDKFVARKE